MTRSRRNRKTTTVAAVVFLVAVFAAASCSRTAQQQSEAIAASTAVTFRTDDGVELAGRLFGPSEASAGIVLAHMFPADQSAWYETAAALGDMGYRVMTFDFRGYCPGGDAGCSQGSKDVSQTSSDLDAALAYLRSLGPSRIGLAGASMGGTASLLTSAGEGDGIAAVVTLSAPQSFLQLQITPDQLATISAAKLFIAGTGDASAAAAAETMYEQSGEPKRVEIVTSNDHGTDLLHGNQGSHVQQLLQGWFAQYLPARNSAAATTPG
jgi:pimeloyl-ACP methyl ester carboxylesterase